MYFLCKQGSDEHLQLPQILNVLVSRTEYLVSCLSQSWRQVFKTLLALSKLPVKPERCCMAFCSSSQSFLMNSIVQLVCETLSSILSSSCSRTFKFSYIDPQTKNLSHLYWDLCQYSFKRLPDFKFASFVPPMTVKAELIVSGRCSVYELQTGLQ